MRTCLVLTVAAAAVLLPASQAAAQGGPRGWVDVGDGESTVELGAEDGEATKAGSGGGSTGCTWRRTTAEEDDRLGLTLGENAAYDWYVKECLTADGSVERQLFAVPKDAPPVDPVTLRDRAVDELALPAPQIRLNPPDDQVVHVESWLWIDDVIWHPHTRTVAAGGVTVTVSATPSHVVWDMGDGNTVTCDGPGTPYDPARPADQQSTDCSHVYAHSSAGRPGDAYLVEATVVWDATWTIAGAAGGGPIAGLSTTTPVSVRVAELQALNQ